MITLDQWEASIWDWRPLDPEQGHLRAWAWPGPGPHVLCPNRHQSDTETLLREWDTERMGRWDTETLWEWDNETLSETLAADPVSSGAGDKLKTLHVEIHPSIPYQCWLSTLMTHIRDEMKGLLRGMRPTLRGNDAERGSKKRPKTNKLDKKWDPTLSNYQASSYLSWLEDIRKMKCRTGQYFVTPKYTVAALFSEEKTLGPTWSCKHGPRGSRLSDLRQVSG